MIFPRQLIAFLVSRLKVAYHISFGIGIILTIVKFILIKAARYMVL